MAATLASVVMTNLLSYWEEFDRVPAAPSGAPSPSAAERDDRWKSMTWTAATSHSRIPRLEASTNGELVVRRPSGKSGAQVLPIMGSARSLAE